MLSSVAAKASDEVGLTADIKSDTQPGRAAAPWLLFGNAGAGGVDYLWTGAYRPDEEAYGVGYRWRKFSFEQLSSGPAAERIDARLYRTRISRLSYKPADNLVLQLARGKISGLDHLMADESLRRTAVSASHVFEHGGVRLENMLAWGRSSRKMRQSTSGFLLESTVRLPGAHTLFGRLEQVGSDEPGLGEVLTDRSRVNRLSIGYVRELDTGPGARLEFGGFVSHYRLPHTVGQGQGDTLLYMMVARLRLR
ncbi:hypothetical protein [Noviherbaspirillum aridicola]|nr:hypothetical protein [Noviherbaspirillum aridicola]